MKERGKMTTLYKLTDQDGYTRRGMSNETLWGEGVEHTAPGGGELCTDSWLHAYPNLNLAVMMNSAHANLKDPIGWVSMGDVGISAPDKVGCTKLITLNKIPLPTPTLNQRIAFGILSALSVHHTQSFPVWAKRWLGGTDRSKDSASAAYTAGAAYAAYAAAYAYAYDADTAVYAAACAAAYAAYSTINNHALDLARIADYSMSRVDTWEVDFENPS
jgi:hypothetical protein